jgi:hypothetical protein
MPPVGAIILPRGYPRDRPSTRGNNRNRFQCVGSSHHCIHSGVGRNAECGRDSFRSLWLIAYSASRARDPLNTTRARGPRCHPRTTRYSRARHNSRECASRAMAQPGVDLCGQMPGPAVHRARLSRRRESSPHGRLSCRDHAACARHATEPPRARRERDARPLGQTRRPAETRRANWPPSIISTR